MGTWFQADWFTMFVPSVPFLEVFLRGTLVYLVLFFLLRFVLRRQAGNISLSDMLLVVLIADATQNAMANEYKSITDGLVLAATLLFWDYVLDWLSYHVPRLRFLVYSSPLLLVHDGRVHEENLRKELITEEQLRSHLRQQQVEDPKQGRDAYLEGDGHVSVFPKEHQETPSDPGNGLGEETPTEQRETDSMVLEAEEAELRQFLDAARALQERMHWHERRSALLKETLARHGVRPNQVVEPAEMASSTTR